MEEINYLRGLLQNDIQYNVRKNIYVSKLIDNECDKEYPCVVLYDDAENSLVLSSNDEFKMVLGDNPTSINNLPRVIHTFTNAEDINEASLLLSSNYSYTDKIEGLIELIDPSMKLKIK